MSRLLVKNFGPIREGLSTNDGFIDIKKCTVFIGTQGSGKSTLAKLISTFSWLEKSLNMGAVEEPKSLAALENFFDYQDLRGYFENNTVIEYHGDAFKIRYALDSDMFPLVEHASSAAYQVPKIMYVPAERNLLSAVENAYDLSLPASVFTFAKELKNAQLQLGGETLKLPDTFGNVSFRHNPATDQSFITGENFELKLSQSSSGFQSFIPAFLVTRYLGLRTMSGETSSRLLLNVNQVMRRDQDIRIVMENGSLSDAEKVTLVNNIRSRYINTCFLNIVEEPEQNLYPASQHVVLNELLQIASLKNANKLVLTTHSPYIINFLTLAIKANSILQRITETGREELLPRLDRIVPQFSTIAAKDVAIYELADGKIQKLADYHGIPSDENYLNDQLAESNEQFAQLQEIQQAL